MACLTSGMSLDVPFAAVTVGSVAGTRGESVLDALRPTDRDSFILKPKHSGFYQTPLP